VTSLRVRAASLLLLGISAVAGSNVACSNQPSAPAPDPAAVLEALPAPDPAQYDRIQDMKKWQNPYLIIRADSVALFDSADSAEIILKTDEVLPALARLPASNWPYGRVVAAAENGVRASEQDGVAIRRNKGIVGGMLESAHIAVKWVPSV
jgi:hypothetical protein